MWNAPPGAPAHVLNTPPSGKTPLWQILLLIGAGLLLTGALVFGAFKFFIGAPTLDTAAYALKEEAADDIQVTAPPAAGSPAQTPLPAPTDMPAQAQSPAPTPAPFAGVDFNSIVVGYEGPGITEDMAYRMFGQPLNREPVDYPDSVSIFLTYDSFVLKFPTEGEAAACYEVEITKAPCPISVFGLEVGMDMAQVEVIMANTPFETDYQDPDEAYWTYTNLSTGQMIFIDFSNRIVTDYSVFYAP
jgi:hypothetical protein